MKQTWGLGFINRLRKTDCLPLDATNRPGVLVCSIVEEKNLQTSDDFNKFCYGFCKHIIDAFGINCTKLAALQKIIGFEASHYVIF